MKFILSALMLCTLSSAFAHESRGPELGTVDAWSDWYPQGQEVDGSQVCSDVIDQFQKVNIERPYEGELVDTLPVDLKTGTHSDGQSYFALSCRIRVYRQIKTTLLSLNR